MQFSILASLLFSLLFVRLSGAISVTQATTAIDTLTKNTVVINELVGAVAASQGLVRVAAVAHETTADYAGLIDELSQDVDLFNGSVFGAQNTTTIFGAQDATTIDASWKKFVQAQLQLTSTVTDKHLVFAQFQVTASIAAILHGFNATLDAFIHTLLNAIPSQSNDVSDAKSYLDSSIQNAITTYERPCVLEPLDAPPDCAGLFMGGGPFLIPTEPPYDVQV